jgi:hypothetical protein
MIPEYCKDGETYSISFTVVSLNPRNGVKQPKNLLLGTVNYEIGRSRLAYFNARDLDAKLKTITVGVATTCDTKVL